MNAQIIYVLHVKRLKLVDEAMYKTFTLYLTRLFKFRVQFRCIFTQDMQLYLSDFQRYGQIDKFWQNSKGNFYGEIKIAISKNKY